MEINYPYSLPTGLYDATLFLNQPNNVMITYGYFCKTAVIQQNDVYQSDCYPSPEPCKYSILLGGTSSLGMGMGMGGGVGVGVGKGTGTGTGMGMGMGISLPTDYWKHFE